MAADALLIQIPCVDFGVFLGLCQQALGYSPSEVVDASPVRRSEPERFLSCLAALWDRQAPAGMPLRLLSHISFSVLVAADERDMLDILQVVSGMPFVVTETLMRSVQLAVITGTAAQWRSAVKAGSSCDVGLNVRALFNRVMVLFESAGVSLWKDYECRPMQDHTFLLEDKRKR